MGADNWAGTALAMQRYTGEVLGPKFSQLFADIVLRASLLSPFTQAGRWSFGLDTLGHLGDFKGRQITDMPEPTRYQPGGSRSLRKSGHC